MFRLLLILLPMCLVFAACQRTGQVVNVPMQSSTLAWLVADDGTWMTTEEFLQNTKVSRVHGIDPIKGLCLWDKANDVAIMDLELIPSGLDALVPIQLLSHEAVDRWIRKDTAKETPWRLRRIVGGTPQELQLEVQRTEQEKPFILSWIPPVRLPRSGQREDTDVERVFGCPLDTWFSGNAGPECCFHWFSSNTGLRLCFQIPPGLPPISLYLSGTNGKQVLSHLLRTTRTHVGVRDGQGFVGTAENLLRAGFVPPPEDPRQDPWVVGLANGMQMTAKQSATFASLIDFGEFLRCNYGVQFAWFSDSSSDNIAIPFAFGERLGHALFASVLSGQEWMTRSGQIFIGSKTALSAASAPRRMVHPLDALSPTRKNAPDRQDIERRLQSKLDGCSPGDVPLEDVLTFLFQNTGIQCYIDSSVSATTPIGIFICNGGSAEVYLSTILRLTKLRYALGEKCIIIGTEEALRNQGYDDPPDLWNPESVDLPWMARLRERLCNKVSLRCNLQYFEDVWFSATKIPLVLEKNSQVPDTIYNFENLLARDILHHLAVLTHTAPILKDGAVWLAAPERIEIERRSRVWKAVASTPSQAWALDIAKVLEKPLPKELLSGSAGIFLNQLEQHTGLSWQFEKDMPNPFEIYTYFSDRIAPNYRHTIENSCFASDLDYCIEPGKIHIGTRDTIAATGLRRNPPIQ